MICAHSTRHTPNSAGISVYAKETHLEWHVPALQHVAGSQRRCQHYDAVVFSVTRFKVLITYFSETLRTARQTRDRTQLHAFVTEDIGLASRSGRPKEVSANRWKGGCEDSEPASTGWPTDTHTRLHGHRTPAVHPVSRAS